MSESDDSSEEKTLPTAASKDSVAARKSDAESSDPSEIVFDGDCPMCRSFIAHLDHVPGKQTDFRRGQLPGGLSEKRAESALHFIDESNTLHRGARAVLHILAKRGGILGALSKIALHPPLIYLADIVYAVIARNRFILFGPIARISALKLCAIVACLVPMLLSFRLWLGDWQRSIPTTPLPIGSNWQIPGIGFPYDLGVYALLLVLLSLAACIPRPRAILLSFVSLAVAYTLTDINRAMPYYVEFYWLFLVLAVFPWPTAANRESEPRKHTTLLSIIGSMLFCIWFWSGVHKLNITYLMVGFPWLVTPFTQYLSAETTAVVNALAIFTPLIESGAALLLLFRSTRIFGICAITLMHLLILSCIGPWGHDYNHSVWSWNLSHILLCWLVFYKTDLRVQDYLVPRSWLHSGLLLWFLVLPLTSYIGLWPRSLSYSLYTWNNKEAIITSSQLDSFHSIPAAIRNDVVRRSNKGVELLVQEWFYRELKSPPFDVELVYESSFEQLCKMSSNPGALQLEMRSAPHPISGLRTLRRSSCRTQ